MISRGQQVLLDILRVTDYLEAGNEVRIDCPFCNNTNKKLYISNKGMYHCFVCGVSGGSITGFLADYYKISFYEAKVMLKDYQFSETYSNIEESNNSQSSIIASLYPVNQVKPVTLKMIPLPTNTNKIDVNNITIEEYPYLKYLVARGVTKRQLDKFDIRYVENGESTTANNKTLYINKSIVFVAYMNHKPVYWNTRSIELHPFTKTYNASGSSDCYSKKNVIFNYDSISDKSIVVICEGVFNALTIDKANINDLAPIATYGKQITDAQLQLIIDKNPKFIYLYLDNDAYLIELNLANRIEKMGYSLDRIKFVPSMFGDKDANDIGVKQSIISILKATSYTHSEIEREKIKIGIEGLGF